VLRRTALTIAAATLVAGVAASAPAATIGRNPVAAENALPGTSSWNTVQAAFRSIEGYTSEVSVAPGDTIHFHVQTEPAARYRIDLYRLGWYQGLGARLITCLPACDRDEQGVSQPVPPFNPDTGFLRAGWPVTDMVTVGRTWVSGYYVAKLFLTSGPASGKTSTVPIIVREGPSRASPILVNAAANTWQAYDSWGGRSLYTFRDGHGSNHVSFDRPYVWGEQNVFNWEYQAVRFLEREGYDVSYTTDVDVDADPAELQRHRLFMALGHDEYWTKAMRDALEATRDAGTNLAFLGGNTGYWQLRYEDNRRTLVEYRIRGVDPEPSPALKTTQFRLLGPPRPECELLGVQWQDGIGFETDFPVNDAALGDRYFAGAGFAPGAVLSRLMGGEWDGVQAGCSTPPLTVFFHFPGGQGRGPGDVTRYTAPSGARVFDGSAEQFSWGLDNWGTEIPAPDPRLQAFMRNVLDDLTRPASPTQLTAVPKKGRVGIDVGRHADARVRWVAVYRHRGAGTFAMADRGSQLVCVTTGDHCADRTTPFPRIARYAAITRDRWGTSFPTYSSPVRIARRAAARDGAAATKLSATLAAAPGVSGIFLATLTQRTLVWQLRVSGLRGPVALRLRASRSGSPIASLCASCKAVSRGKDALSAAAVATLRAGHAYLEVRPAGSAVAKVRARVVLGVPTLRVTEPKDGDTITLPAQIAYSISAFAVGGAPLGHIEASASGGKPIEIAVSTRSGTATLPDVKSAFLPGLRDLTFVLATADGVPLPNPEAAVSVHGVAIAGRR
jgi:hypothetical protein